MIPKIIHYCWFGNKPITDFAQKCIDSWRKALPDYKIMRWDENNFDIEYNNYTREAAIEKKWAFVSDVARLYALYNYGGLYFDTDLEIIGKLDGLIKGNGIIGFESNKTLSTAFIACNKGNLIIKELLEDYNHIHFRIKDSLDLTPNVRKFTNKFKVYGLVLNNTRQTIADFEVYPRCFFSPKDPLSKKIDIEEYTVAIHHFDGSWGSSEDKYKHTVIGRLIKHGVPIVIARVMGKTLAIIKYRGIKGVFKEIVLRVFRKCI